MPREKETFRPCDACISKLARVSPAALDLSDPTSWIYFCDECRKKRRDIQLRNEVRTAQDPVAGAFNVRTEMRFEVEKLREQLVAMFTLREDELRAKVQTALEMATTDEAINATIEKHVKEVFHEEFKRALHWTIKSAIEKKLGSEAVKQRIADTVERELKFMREYLG